MAIAPPNVPDGPPPPWWARLASWFSAVSPRQPLGAPSSVPRVLGAWALISMGVGATIGAGIFVTTGQVARDVTGPAVMLSFVLAGLACVLAGLCYAEFAALHPTGGSAYSYAYATMGELLAWIIGWDLVLEYAVAGCIVAVGWSEHFVELFHAFGVTVPEWIIKPVNFPAALIVIAITYLLIRGVEESAKANNAMVILKVGIVLFVILVGVWFVNPGNWVNFPRSKVDVPENLPEWLNAFFRDWVNFSQPSGNGFFPFGYQAVVTGAALVFFAYIGFDAVSTHAEETRNPGRNLPIGILVSLLICTLLYFGVAAVLTGMIPWPALAQKAPVAAAFGARGMAWADIIISLGALAGMTSVLIVTFSGQARIFRSMARDGLLPRRVFGGRGPHHVPTRSIILTGSICTLAAALLPFDILLEMVSIGTLMAFAIVCLAVMILRRAQPNIRREFRCPWVYMIGTLGIAVNVYMMTGLPLETWLRLLVWLGIGLVIYFGYGFWNSILRKPHQQLLVLEGAFAVCRLPPGAPSPAGGGGGGFISVTRTADEVSVVCLETAVPDGATCERGWRCLRVAGAMPLSAVGVLASLTAPLASAGISVFAVSTFDTDYLLVRAADFENAVATLREAGHTLDVPGVADEPQAPQ